MKNKKSINTQILLVFAILLVINILSNRFFFRLDFTSDNRYTLSQATKNILKSLDEPVTVTAYFTEDLPPNIAVVRREFKDLLVEYANISRGNVVYEFVDPNKDPQIEQKAFQSGVKPVMINTREKDEATQKKVFLGAVVQKGEESEVIPFIQPGSAFEYDLSSSIKKLTAKDKPVIGFVQGYGCPSPNSMPQAMKPLEVLYNIEPVNLNDSVNLQKYKTVALIAPKDTIPESAFKKLDNYLAGGGNLYIALNRVDANLQNAQGTVLSTGLEKWLEGKGLVVEPDFVVDASCGSIGVQQRTGSFNFTTNVKFPYLPIIVTFADNPITSGLEQVIMPFASSIKYTGDTANVFTPIAMTSEKSGTQSAPLYFDINKKWNDTDFPMSKIPVGVTLQGKLVGNIPSSIVLFSDGDFALNGEGQNQKRVSEDNVNLMVNSIDWLSDDTGLIELRTKGVTSRPLDQIEEGRKVFLKWLNFLLPILLVLLYGVLRMQRKRSIRVKRMEPGNLG
jgi:gliding-associated putative ABC transporter substrate-binding component GldG